MALRISGKNVDIGEASRMRSDDIPTEILPTSSKGGCGCHVGAPKRGRAFASDGIIRLDTRNRQGDGHVRRPVPVPAITAARG